MQRWGTDDFLLIFVGSFRGWIQPSPLEGLNSRGKLRSSVKTTRNSHWFFPPLVSSRCSHGVLRWTGQPLPAPRLLPRPSHQHDRGEGRPGDSGHPWAPSQLGARVPAPPAPVHGQGPEAAGSQHGHRVPHETAAARRGGSGAWQPALVLLGETPGRQNETGGAENPKGLRGASHREPALSESHPGGKLIFFFFCSFLVGSSLPPLLLRGFGFRCPLFSFFLGLACSWMGCKEMTSEKFHLWWRSAKM